MYPTKQGPLFYLKMHAQSWAHKHNINSKIKRKTQIYNAKRNLKSE